MRVRLISHPAAQLVRLLGFVKRVRPARVGRDKDGACWSRGGASPDCSNVSFWKRQACSARQAPLHLDL